MPRFLALAGVLACALASVASAQILDPTFGGDGVARIRRFQTSAVSTKPFALVARPDGSVLALGEGVARFGPDQRLDASFGLNGIANTNTPDATVLLPDGSILAAGTKPIRGRLPDVDNNCGRDSLDADVWMVKVLPSGQADASFGQNGEALYDTPRPTSSAAAGSCSPTRYTDDRAHALALDASGKAVFAGTSSTLQEGSRALIGRLNADGTLDPTFGERGLLVLPRAVLQSSQGIIARPNGYVVAGDKDGVIGFLRIHLDGRLDSTQGPAWVEIEGVRGPVVARPGPGGTIVVGGRADSSEVYLRFTANLQPDSSFGTNGAVRLRAGNLRFVRALDISPTGELVAGGVSAEGVPWVTRLRADGTVVHRTQGGLPSGALPPVLTSVAFVPSGGYAVAGTDGPGYTNFLRGLVAFFTSDGTPGPLNRLERYRQEVVFASVELMHAFDDGSLVASTDQYAQRLARLSPQGVLTETLATPNRHAPRCFVPLSSGNVLVLTGDSLAVLSASGPLGAHRAHPVPWIGCAPARPDAQGRSVVAGSVRLTGGSYDAVLARYLSDGTPDESFGPLGYRTYHFGTVGGAENDGATGATHDAEGRIYITGYLRDVPGLARLRADGRVDSTFGQSGVVHLRHPLLAAFSWQHVTVLPDGRIRVLIQSRTTTNERVLATLGFLPNGATDAAFGDSGIRVVPYRSDLDRFEPLALADRRVAVLTAEGGRIGVMLVHPDGTLDPRMGPDGVQWTPLVASNYITPELAQGPGDVLYVGTTHLQSEGSDATFVKLHVPAFTVETGESGETTAPSALALSPPAPTPTRDAASVRFSLDAPGTATLAVFDVLGREVLRLVDGPLPAGPHTATLDASALPPGRYLVRLSAGGHRLVQPLVRMR